MTENDEFFHVLSYSNYMYYRSYLFCCKKHVLKTE